MPDWIHLGTRLVCCPSESDFLIECNNHLDVMGHNSDNRIHERQLMDYFTPVIANLRIV